MPLLDLLAGVELVAEDNQIRRRNRRRTLTSPSKCGPGGKTLEATFAANSARNRSAAAPAAMPAADREAITSRVGSPRKARGDHSAGLLGLMFLITVLLFGTFRQPLVIWLTVPMVIGGVA